LVEKYIWLATEKAVEICMFKQLTTALSKASGLLGTIINKVSGVGKPCRKFLIWLFERWWMLPVRYNFLNLSRYGGYGEKAIRTQMSRELPFVELFHELFASLRAKKCICAFDPSFVSWEWREDLWAGRVLG
jgi:hypothetical protein